MALENVGWRQHREGVFPHPFYSLPCRVLLTDWTGSRREHVSEVRGGSGQEPSWPCAKQALLDGAQHANVDKRGQGKPLTTNVF